jgi:hypothetical protein
MRNKVQQLARYYLAELWGDSDFRADWQRVKEAVSQDAELAELWQRVQNPDLSPEERMRADCAILWRVKTELREFCTRWKLPTVIARAFELELATPPETRAFYDRVVPDPAAYELQRLQERIIAEAPTGQVVVIREAEEGGLIATLEPQLPEPPLKCLPEPDPATETQSEYIRRICTSIPLTANTSEPETYLQKAIREYRERFNNRRAGAGKVKELARRYYEACFAVVGATRFDRGTEEEYLRRVARQVYLRVVEGKTWSKIVDTLRKERWLKVNWKWGCTLDELSQKERKRILESWRQTVAATTLRACEWLGIPDARV